MVCQSASVWTLPKIQLYWRCLCLFPSRKTCGLRSSGLADIKYSSLLESSNTVQWLGPKGNWWIQSKARLLQLHPFIGQRWSISSKASPWLPGMELAGGAFWRFWHPLQPYQTAVNQGRLYCKVSTKLIRLFWVWASNINGWFAMHLGCIDNLARAFVYAEYLKKSKENKEKNDKEVCWLLSTPFSLVTPSLFPIDGWIIEQVLSKQADFWERLITDLTSKGNRKH